MNEQLASKIRSRLSGGESYDHMSPSSLNIPIQKYIISYVCSTQAMRRQNKVGYKAHSGNLVVMFHKDYYLNIFLKQQRKKKLNQNCLTRFLSMN
jgi:hypothetical protein